MTNGSSRDKGKRGEREAAKKWIEVFDSGAHRSQQYKGADHSSDLTLEVPGISAEVKRIEKLSLYPAIEKAADDAADDSIPIVLHRRSRKRWLFVAYLEDMPELARLLHELGDDNE